jgi:hypothetical protein
MVVRTLLKTNPIEANNATRIPLTPNRKKSSTPRFMIPARITPQNISFDISRQYLPYSCIINSRFFCFIFILFSVGKDKQ